MVRQINDPSSENSLTREICLKILYAALLEQTDLTEVAARYGATAFEVFNWGKPADIECGSGFVSVEITKDAEVALDDLGSS
ncbi:hypothetical protein [Kiloniella sp. EL199]|uniref:hypothetical protein n=1 Tax=Kiloniella sp. EL199 TaxID=2107581 RepID=UPI000EA4082E|nr:hypothetical protein [Kiloniella sp. EL199]